MNRTTDDQIGEALRRIVRAIDLHSRSLMREHRLTAPQLAVLRELKQCGCSPVGHLAKAVHLGAPTVTGIVDRLERQALVRRVRCEHDRRQVLIEITDEGRSLAERKPSLLSAPLRQKLTELQDWERTQILSTLQRVAAMMEAPLERAAQDGIQEFASNSKS